MLLKRNMAIFLKGTFLAVLVLTAVSGSAFAKKKSNATLESEEALKMKLEEMRISEERRRADEMNTAQSSPVYQSAEPAMTTTTTTTTTKTIKQEDPNKVRFQISPRGGVATMRNPDDLDVRSRGAIGVGVGLEMNDVITVEGGYNYQQYGVSLVSTNPFVKNLQASQATAVPGTINSNLEVLNMKQNLFEAGIKGSILGRDSMIRPFVDGGGAYSQLRINYDQNIVNQLNAVGLPTAADNYRVNSFLGYIGAGVDVGVTKGVSIGGAFKYYRVLTSEEEFQLNNFAFLGNPNTTDFDKQLTGGSVARSDFYSFLASMTVSF